MRSVRQRCVQFANQRFPSGPPSAIALRARERVGPQSSGRIDSQATLEQIAGQRDEIEQVAVVRGNALARIRDHQDQITGIESAPCSFDPDSFHWIPAVLNAGRVHDDHRRTVDMEDVLHDVACRSRHVTHDQTLGI